MIILFVVECSCLANNFSELISSYVANQHMNAKFVLPHIPEKMVSTRKLLFKHLFLALFIV